MSTKEHKKYKLTTLEHNIQQGGINCIERSLLSQTGNTCWFDTVIFTLFNNDILFDKLTDYLNKKQKEYTLAQISRTLDQDSFEFGFVQRFVEIKQLMAENKEKYDFSKNKMTKAKFIDFLYRNRAKISDTYPRINVDFFVTCGGMGYYDVLYNFLVIMTVDCANIQKILRQNMTLHEIFARETATNELLIITIGNNGHTVTNIAKQVKVNNHYYNIIAITFSKNNHIVGLVRCDGNTWNLFDNDNMLYRAQFSLIDQYDSLHKFMSSDLYSGGRKYDTHVSTATTYLVLKKTREINYSDLLFGMGHAFFAEYDHSLPNILTEPVTSETLLIEGIMLSPQLTEEDIAKLIHNDTNNKTDMYGNTPLMLACERKLHTVAKAIIESGNINEEQINEANQTALIRACKYELHDIALYLVEETKNPLADHVDDVGDNALLWACRNKMEAIAEKIIPNSKLDQVNNQGNTALILACRSGMDAVAEKLIPNGKPDQVNNTGDTALIWACCNKMEAIAEKLIPNGKPEQVSNNGNTALIWACYNTMDALAEKLIPYSKLDQVNNNGNTALILACKNKMKSVIKKILEIPDIRGNKKYIEHKNSKGETALDYARTHDTLEEILPLLTV